MSDAVIHLENVSKFYKLYDSPRDRLKEALLPFGGKRHREFYALKNVHLEVRRGEILGIVGRNGSGKSTLLQVVAKVIPVNGGRLTTRGKISTLLDLGAGFNPEYTGMQNIFFSGLMLGYSREEMKGRLEEIVSFADIGSFIQQPLKTYSSGMRARLGFALAVNVNPEILLVDEVLAVGDEFFRRKCYDRIEKMLTKGCTVLMVSHDMNAVIQFCSRAIVLDQGELLLSAEPKIVTAQYQRLVFSDPESQPVVREEIRRLGRERECVPITAAQTAPHVSAASAAPAASEDFFIPGLVAAKTMVAESPHAALLDIHLESEDNRRVNVLRMNGRYRLVYRVVFEEELENVFFTMAVTNEKGLNVSSSETCNGTTLFHARVGQAIRVEWSFTCRLLPRDYFVNVGVYHLDNDGNTVLIGRVTDALLFRVLSESRTSYRGLVHLDQRCHILEVS